MPDGVKLATAYVQIVASASGMRRDVAKELNHVAGDAERTGKESGKRLTAGVDAGVGRKRFGKGMFKRLPTDASDAGKKAGGKFKSSMSSALKGFGAGLLAGVATDKVVGFLKDAAKGASDLEQSVGGVDAVFKDFAPNIEKASKTAAQSLGLTRNEYNELAATLGAGLKNKGIKDFGKQSQNLIGIGADLSATFGGSTQDAVAALGSAMRGEMDPIEKYGITLNQAAIEAEAVTSGLVKNVKDKGKIKAAQNEATIAQRKYNEAVKKYGKNSNEALSAEGQMIRTQAALGKAMDGKVEKLTDQQKAQAALQLINKQSGDAQGAFAREASTAAGKQARLTASWENLKTTIGEKLLPVLSTVTGAANDFMAQMEKGEGVGGKFKDIVVAIWKAVSSAVDFFIKYKKQMVALGLVIGTTVVAMRAYQITTKLATLWTKRQAIMQGLLNRAMMMNPVGLVVAALVALGIGLVIAYKKSETFRRIVNAAWAGIKKAASATVDWFKKTAWPAIKTVFSAIGAVAKWLWQKGIKPAFNGIKNVIVWWYNTIVKRYFGLVKLVFKGLAATAKWLWQKAIKPAFSGIVRLGRWLWAGLKWSFDKVKSGFRGVASVAKWLWNKGVKPPFNFIKLGAQGMWRGVKKVFDKLKSGIRGVKTTFSTVKDGIGKIWDKLTGTIRKPITKALDWIETHFLSKVRSVLRTIGADALAKKIPVLRASNPSPKRRQNSGLQKYATGGKIRGPWRGPAADNVLGISHSGVPTAWVNPKEYILPVDATRRLERQVGPGGLESLRRGQLPGYRMGGKVGGLKGNFLAALNKFNEAAGGRFSVISGLRSRAEQQALYNKYLNGTGNLAAKPGTSRHESGNAADLAPSNARDTHGALARKFGLHFPVPGEAWHIELIGGGGPRGGGGGAFSGLAGRILEKGASVLTGLLDKAPGGFWVKTGVAAMKHTIKGVVDRVNAAAEAGDGSSPSGSFKGGNVERWRGTVLKALGIMGLSDKYANSTLRRMNQESGGNPHAINKRDSNAKRGTPSKGLMQVIDPTFRAYAHPSYRSNIYDPLSNILASMRYAQSRYGSLWSAYDRKGGYAKGGLVQPPVFDNGGILAPGLNLVNNKLGRPETLVRPEQMAPPVVNVGVYLDGDELSALVQTEIGLADNFAGALGRMG